MKFTFSDNEDDGTSSRKRKHDFDYSQCYDNESDEDVIEVKQYKTNKPALRVHQSEMNSQQQLSNAKSVPKVPPKIVNNVKPIEIEPEVISFDVDEIVPQTIEEKISIACKQPLVKINHSQPFPIALVEETTNVVFSKAVLLNHLYQSYSSPCILCPMCRKFLSVAEFSKHLHLAHEESEENVSNKSFNILPYRTKSAVTEYDMSTWKLFGKRYTEFKKERLLKRERQRTSQKISSKNRNKENDGNSNKENNDYLKAIKSLNWNYVSKDKSVFIINKILLENDQIVNLNSDGLSSDNILNETAHSIKADELSKSKTVNKGEEEEDLVLSEDEDNVNEDEQLEVTNPNNNDEVKIVDDEDVNIKYELNEDTKKKNVNNDYEKLSSSSSSSSIILNYNLPSIKSRYFNFYENLNYETLMYICDNQYTIIPTTYIEYIHCKCDNNATKNSYNLNALIL